jgi:hypothetical protein
MSSTRARTRGRISCRSPLPAMKRRRIGGVIAGRGDDAATIRDLLYRSDALAPADRLVPHFTGPDSFIAVLSSPSSMK